MNRTDPIGSLVDRFRNLPTQDVDRAVRALLETLSNSLSAGERIEVRGFGSFSLRIASRASRGIRRPAPQGRLRPYTERISNRERGFANAWLNLP